MLKANKKIEAKEKELDELKKKQKKKLKYFERKKLNKKKRNLFRERNILGLHLKEYIIIYYQFRHH